MASTADAMRELLNFYGRNYGPILIWAWWAAGIIVGADVRERILPVWSWSEYPRDLGTQRWLKLFRATGYVSDSHLAPSEPITLYRGAVESRRRGMSWTTDPIVAERFAARRPILVRGRIVYRQRQVWQVTIPPKAVLARIEGRQESEVIVNPRMLPRDW
jgi:hypothetical protein